MKMLNQNLILLGLCAMLAPAVAAQELAAFKIPDSPRAYLFNLTPYPDGEFTNSTLKTVEGITTILAKRFKTIQGSGVVTITFSNAIVCRATRRQGEGLDSPVGSPVMTFKEFSIVYHAAARVLVHGRFVPLADLSEKMFDPPTTFNRTYTGEEAIKKLKEMGLEPPEDMERNPEQWKSAK